MAYHRTLKMLTGWLALFALIPRPAPASEIPAGGVTSGMGINIHFARGHERDLDLIAAAGFKFARMDFFWQETEPKKGVYDWSAYDELTANLERRGICAYYIFDYSNPLYEEKVPGKNSGHWTLASPDHPESVAAFARWAAAAAAHFRGHHIIWEIWNEPNGSFWKPKADVNAYLTLALATAKVVRTANPGATIVAPATSGFPWPFLQEFLQSGMLKYLDAVSVHPYRSPRNPPETAAKDYRRLREMIATNMPPNHGPIPIISGEWGYSTFAHGVSEKTQAAYCVRQQLANSLGGVPLSIWYDWKNDGGDPNENEDNFGTVHPDLTPKPAYTAINAFSRELAGYSIRSRLPVGGTNDFVLVLTNAAGETRLAAWTLGRPHALVPSLPPDVSNKQIQLPLDMTPRYFSIDRP